MRPLPLLAILSALAIGPSGATPDELAAASRVSAVTVYPGMAMVERSSEIDLPQGA